MIDAIHQLLLGAAVSLLLAIVGITCGTILGVLLTTLGFSRFVVFRLMYRLVVFLVRGTPLLVLALLMFYSLPELGLRAGPYLVGAFVLSLYTSVFFAEVFRGGVLAIPRAQWESARSLGLPPIELFRRIVAPLAVRYSLPAYINICVMTIKASSILSIISVWELTLASREIIERTLWVFSTLGFAAFLYFTMCFTLDRAGGVLERHLMRKGFVGVHA
jgi:His/Glu/Gln/Arg/opine family amino acid ABC transporter permease subunit